GTDGESDWDGAPSASPTPAPAPGPAPGPALLAPESRLDRARRIARRAGPYAACVLAGVLLGIALKPSAKRAPAVATPPAAAPAVGGAEAGLPDPELPAKDPRAPAPRDCTARVTTKPAGAVVFWGDLAIGTSPIERAAVPCGTAIVTFRRERFAEAT